MTKIIIWSKKHHIYEMMGDEYVPTAWVAQWVDDGLSHTATVLKEMMQAGLVERRKGPRNGKGRPSYEWRRSDTVPAYMLLDVG